MSLRTVDRQRVVLVAPQHGRSTRDGPISARQDRGRRPRARAAIARAVRHRAARTSRGRLDGGAADLRVGGSVPREGQTGCPDSRYGEEHPARLHLHRSSQGGHHFGSRIPRWLVRILLGRARGSRPARPDLVGHGVLKRSSGSKSTGAPSGSRRRTTSRSASRTPTSTQWTRTTSCAWRGSGSTAT